MIAQGLLRIQRIQPSFDPAYEVIITSSRHNGVILACFLSLARSKLRLCLANHRAGYFSDLTCDLLSLVWAYPERETENGPWCPRVILTSMAFYLHRHITLYNYSYTSMMCKTVKRNSCERRFLNKFTGIKETKLIVSRLCDAILQ